MTQPIKFGTDGWRAVIADGYTFENLAKVTQATAQWLHRHYTKPTVLIGHDARFMGRAFAEHAARVFVAAGVEVKMAVGITTTPAISWATKAHGRSAGIVITASHNPPEYNGFKIKADFGGPATPTQIAEVEEELNRLPVELERPATYRELIAERRVTERDVMADYLNMMRQTLDIDAILNVGLRIAHDPMFGAGQGVVSRLLGQDHVVEIHGTKNPGFEGRAPEPIERNLNELSKLVVETGCAVGLANDGDADRIGMYDEKGQFVSSHLILALLVKYLHEVRGLTGSIVKTFSTSHMLDKMGTHYGFQVQTLPIGFKYIASKIITGDVLVGGEESGGIAVKGHVPERDGIYIGLLIVEMMVKRGLPLSALVQELFDDFGPHYYHRVDLHTTPQKKEAALKRLEQEGGLKEIAGHPIVDLQTLDGYKHVAESGWLLVRPSGTEPVLRIYAEAPTIDEAKKLVQSAVAQLGLA